MLALLPGLDGTGELFAPFMAALTRHPHRIVPLPATGDQRHAALAARLRDGLPCEPFVLVAESFSGPIGAALARDPPSAMRGIAFVATFLSPPPGAGLGGLLPVKPLALWPGARSASRAVLLGPRADPEVAALFERVLRGLDARLVRERLAAIAALRARPGGPAVDLPALYLRATADWLVRGRHADEFGRSFPRLRVEAVRGPHFLLQARPVPCAALIEAFADECLADG